MSLIFIVKGQDCLLYGGYCILSYPTLFLFYLMNIFYILGDCHLYDYLKKNKNQMKWNSLKWLRIETSRGPLWTR
jgi:hypothetical protein